MTMRVLAIAMTAFLVPAAAAAQSSGLDGRWTLSVRGGSILPIGGDLHDGGSGSVLGLPTNVSARSNNDIYDAGFGFRAGLGYGVTPRMEVFGEFAYGKADAQQVSVGNVAGLDLRAQFAEYTSRGLEGGLRFHFAPDATLRPYMALVGGVKWIDEIPATFSVPAAGVTLTDTPFYDASVVPVFGGDLGLAFPVAPRVSLGIEVGLRYHTKLQDLEGLAGTGLENLNDVGDRWSFPIVGALQVRF
jgi:hypothetical protein